MANNNDKIPKKTHDYLSVDYQCFHTNYASQIHTPSGTVDIRGHTETKIIRITGRLNRFGLLFHHDNLQLHAMNNSDIILPSNCEKNSIFEWLFRYEVPICKLGSKLQCPNHDCHDHELDYARQLLNSCIGFHFHGNPLCTREMVLDCECTDGEK